MIWRRITLSGICIIVNSSDDTKVKSNNCWFKNKLKKCLLMLVPFFICLFLGKFIKTSGCLFLKIFSKQYLSFVVFLLLLLCFWAVVQLFLLCEICEMFCHFVLLYQNNPTLSQGFLVAIPFLPIKLTLYYFYIYWCHFLDTSNVSQNKMDSAHRL